MSRVGIAAGLSACVVGSAGAHDEDWRKLADRLPAQPGEIFRNADAELSIAGIDLAGSQPYAAASPTGVELLSQIPINQFGGVNPSGNDCWGYTSPSGREYAIIGLERAFGFVEVTDPTNPVIINTIFHAPSIWHDVKVVGSYAYGVSEGGSGVAVYDLSQIDSGVVTLVDEVQTGGHSTTHNIVANEEAGTLYLAGANVGGGGLVHLDLSNPERPTIDGGWTSMYVHDAQVVTWKSGPFAGREIAFCASGFNGGSVQTGLRVVDMTNPNSPQLLATLFYPSAGYSHQVWITEDQSTLYLNDELDENGGLVGETTTRVIDVSDPANPELKGTYSAGVAAIDHNLYVHNGLIFQANYRSGLRVFEAGDPLAPTQIGYYDTFPSSDSAQFNGAWSVYPFFASGTVIVSDIERGLFVMRVDAPEAFVGLKPVGGERAFLDAGGTESLALRVFERQAEIDPASVTLVLEDAISVQRVPGQQGSGGVYSFDLPLLSCESAVTYSFEARATDGRLFTYPAEGEPPLTALAVTGIEDTFADDFESNLGWQVSGNAIDGQWTRGVPVNAGRGDPPSDADGSGSAFVTDNSAANGGNSDVDNGFTRLVSPPFDTSGGALVSYDYWFGNFGTEIASDALTVEISTNNGSTWTQIARHNTPGASWRTNSYSVAASVGSTATRLRFTANDDDPQSVVEAGVDAVRVQTYICEQDVPTPCNAADLSEPLGELDIQDLKTLTELQVDLNTDGRYDFLDVIDALNLLGAGCN